MQFRQPFTGDYIITLDYGEKFPPLYTDESPHRGIDYGCPEGTPILASEAGTVTFVGDLSVGYGKYIIITHDSVWSTLYAHLSKITVKQGQTVSKGQTIGLSGNTGNSTGPHLHFEVRKNNIQISPRSVLQNVIDNIPSSQPEEPKFAEVHSGLCMVVCDVANVRCHCNMNRIVGQRKMGDTIIIGDKVTIFNGLPYRDYFDTEYLCWLRIAEHDPYTQMIENQ